MVFHEIQCELKVVAEELHIGIADPEWMDSVCNLRDLRCAAQHITDMLEGVMLELAHDVAAALPPDLFAALVEPG